MNRTRLRRFVQEWSTSWNLFSAAILLCNIYYELDETKVCTGMIDIMESFLGRYTVVLHLQALVFLLVSVCCDTAQASMFLLVLVCWDTAKAKARRLLWARRYALSSAGIDNDVTVNQLLHNLNHFLSLVSMCCDTAQAFGVLDGVSVL